MHNREYNNPGSPEMLQPAGRACKWATLCALLLACANTAPAQQPTTGDPVQDVVLVLRRSPDKDNPEELQQRKDTLAATIAKLKTIDQLGDVLMLPDWRDDDTKNMPVAEIDVAARNQVAERFEAEVRKTLSSEDVYRKQAVVSRLIVMAVDARRPKNGIPYMRDRLAALALDPEVRNQLNSKDRDLRQTAVAALVNMEKRTQDSMSIIRDVLAARPKGRDVEDRLAAVRTLQRFYLPPGLTADEERERTIVSRIVELGAPALPVICLALADPDVEVRRVAASILLQIADDWKGNFAIRYAQDRTAIAPLLEAIQKQTAALADSVGNTDVSVRVMVLKALDQLAIIRSYLVPHGDDPKREATQGKDPLFGDLPLLRDALAGRLTDNDADTRVYAIEVLERLKQDAVPTTPMLAKALKDPNPFVRWSAARALGVIEGARRQAKLPPAKGAENAVDGLIGLIHKRDPQLRDNLDLDTQIAAINALPSFEQDAAPAVDALGEVAGAGYYTARLAALDTLKSLWSHGVTKRPPSALITRALADRFLDIPVPQTQIMAAELLGLYGPAAADAIPALHDALRDPDVAVRRAASNALLLITR